MKRFQVADVNQTCQCCKKVWKAQMQQSGKTLHLCSRHALDLIHARQDKSGDTVAKFLADIYKSE